MHQSFAVHAHIASVRSVHSSKRYLASGGADDRVYVYDMKTRQEIQVGQLGETLLIAPIHTKCDNFGVSFKSIDANDT